MWQTMLLFWYVSSSGICNRLCESSGVIMNYHMAIVTVISLDSCKLSIRVVDYPWILELFCIWYCQSNIDVLLSCFISCPGLAIAVSI